MKGLEQIRPAKTWNDVEAAIKVAVELGILVDKRGEMPRGRDAKGNLIEWKQKRLTPADVLGHCLHQNGSKNFTNPKATANYHTGAGNHITPGRPMPSTVYHIMIPDIDGPAWLTVDLSFIVYGQGFVEAGDENRHLLTVLCMGGFEDSGFKRAWTKPGPSDRQLENLSMVVAFLQRVFDYGGEGYFGHFHFGKSSCPGRELRHWTDAARDADDKADFLSDKEWQEALLRWNPKALPKHGADGDWGRESKYWLTMFQRAQGVRQTGVQDPFSELILLQRYPDKSGEEKSPLGYAEVLTSAKEMDPPVEEVPTEVRTIPIRPEFDTSEGED